ncbi:unnamed protein product [Toxocara canis]|uniref:Alkylated DNA repair protein alkB-like protein 1 n=1 Tax=Toxocara canis TaxID=6265 RepID=A0A183UQM9_TOXCA|nr:unnamed protein product [Toxocara canis]
MLSRITIIPFRNSNLNWPKANQSFYINIKQFTMSVCAGLPNTADNSCSSKTAPLDAHANGNLANKSNSDSVSRRDSSTCLDSLPINVAERNHKWGSIEDTYSRRSCSPPDSVFKRAFKFYKKRCPPPDLSNVIEFRATPLAKGVERAALKVVESVSSEAIRAVGMKPLSEWKLFTMIHRQGLFVLSDIFEPSKHLEWIARCLNVYPEAPNRNNVLLHISDASKIFVNHANKLRWATLGYHYDWATKVYPSSGDPLPEELVSVADLISHVLGIGPMQADAAIVNYYPPKSALSPHIDRSERFLARPLISLSFGQSAVYLSGGTSLDDHVDALFLHSGDVLVMHGDQRLVYHAVPCIQKTLNFEANAQFSEQIVHYANNNRINVTIRQVDRH